MAKHYIRLDGELIIKGFSDDFEQPEEGDICIVENGGRQFQLFGKTNPSVLDQDGFSLYKYIEESELIKKATPNEQPGYTAFIATKEIADSKISKLSQIKSNTVKESGMTFDADEDSQNRIQRAITALTLNQGESIDWILSDNSVEEVSLDILKNVLEKSFTAQSNIWTKE